MKLIKRNIYTLLLILLMLTGATAQNHIRFNYDVSFPTGNTKDYISNISGRGGTFEFGHHITSQFALGLRIGLQTFTETLNKDVFMVDENTSIYGKQYRYINSFPTMLTAQYNLNELNGISPFVGIGAGAYYFQMKTNMGLYNVVNDYNWNFGFQPEVGLLFNTGQNVGLNVSARYNYIFENQSIDSQGYFNLSVGIMLYNLGEM